MLNISQQCRSEACGKATSPEQSFILSRSSKVWTGTLLQVLGTEIHEQLKLTTNNPAESNRKDELPKKVLRHEKLQWSSNTYRPTSMSGREYLYLQSGSAQGSLLKDPTIYFFQYKEEIFTEVHFIRIKYQQQKAVMVRHEKTESIWLKTSCK